MADARRLGIGQNTLPLPVKKSTAAARKGHALKAPLLGEFSGPPGERHRLGSMQSIDTRIRRFHPGEEVDYAIVGVGAGGGVLLQRLARAGFRVVGFDAGPFWDTERDWVSDEQGAHNLYWNDKRITAARSPLALGANNSGKGVGGSTVHWASFTPRFSGTRLPSCW